MPKGIEWREKNEAKDSESDKLDAVYDFIMRRCECLCRRHPLSV